jgi:hypothetical protein
MGGGYLIRYRHSSAIRHAQARPVSIEAISSAPGNRSSAGEVRKPLLQRR